MAIGVSPWRHGLSGFKCLQVCTIYAARGALKPRAQALSQLSLAHSLTKP